MAQDRPQMARDGPGEPQGGPREPQRGPQAAPETPKAPQENQQRLKTALWLSVQVFPSVNPIFAGQDDLIMQRMAKKSEEQTCEMDNARADNIGDMMEEIFLHDPDNAADFKGMYKEVNSRGGRI